MNLTDMLLVCLGEEASEIAQATAKALRFGLDDGYPGTTRTNRGDIHIEVNHLIAVVEMLRDRNELGAQDRAIIEDKKNKLAIYMGYSVACGKLDNGDGVSCITD